MASTYADYAEFEWMKHKPTWGSIPAPRMNHFAFVYKTRMYIVGGSMDSYFRGTGHRKISYLDLITWTWSEVSTTGLVPASAESYIWNDSTHILTALHGPDWAIGSQQIFKHFKLDIESLEWTVADCGGRWSPSWNVKATLYNPKNNRIYQLGNHTYSNFSDNRSNSVMEFSVATNKWSSWPDLRKVDKDSQLVSAHFFPPNSVLILFQSESGDVNAVVYDVSTGASFTSSKSVDATIPEHSAIITLNNRIYYLNTSALSDNRICYIDISSNNSISGAGYKNIKFPNRAPQQMRLGASVVHHDGYLIFFGGATSLAQTEFTNDVHVLEVGPHSLIERLLDEFEKEDAENQAKVALVSSDPVNVVEVSENEEKKKKKKRPKKKVVFDDEEEEAPTTKEKEEAPPSSSSSSASTSNHNEDPPSKKLSSYSSPNSIEPAVGPDKDVAEVNHETVTSAPPPGPPLSQDTSVAKATIPIHLPVLKHDAPLQPRILPTTSDPLGVTDHAPALNTDNPPNTNSNLFPPIVQNKEITTEELLQSLLDQKQGNLIELLEYACDNPDCFPDMAIKVNGRIFWAHKAIIASRSSKWRKFLEPTQQNRKGQSPASKSDSKKKKHGNGDNDDSQLDVSGESAMPKERASPLMFGRLGSNAIDLLLEEESESSSSGPVHEMIPLPIRGSSLKPQQSSSNSASFNAAFVASSGTLATTSSSDSVSSTNSNGGISPPSTSVPCWTLDENYDPTCFLKVLRYMYTGSITIDSSQRETIGEVAYEFLLDDLSRMCHTDEASIDEASLKLKRMLRRLVGAPLGSDYFFVVCGKKLFAHRFVIYLFSPYFRQLMLSRPGKAYVEVKEIDEMDLTPAVFIDFCRMMYCNYSAIPEHQEKKMDSTNLSILATKWKEYRCLGLLQSGKADVKGTLMLYRLNVPIVRRDARKAIILHFSKFCQEVEALQSLSRREQDEWLRLATKGGASPLDMLWFAHNTGNDPLKAESLQTLAPLINVENVVPILFGAHHIGEKNLRSTCMDYITAHSQTIEDSRRMQADAPVQLNRITSLSESVNREMQQKMSGVHASVKEIEKVNHCRICGKTFKYFGKKSTCVLCHCTVCENCTKKKVTIPAVFGIQKAKDVCIRCFQVVDMWGTPSSSTASSSPSK